MVSQLKGALLELIQFVSRNILYTLPNMRQVHWQTKAKLIKSADTPSSFAKSMYYARGDCIN